MSGKPIMEAHATFTISCIMYNYHLISSQLK